MQILEQLPHPNLVEAVLKSALTETNVLELISLLPHQLHSAALNAYAPSITRCQSLRLPLSEHHAKSSLSAMVAATSFTSLTCLEMFHSSSTELGPSDGICPLPSDLQLPDTCIYHESDARRFWDSMKDACIMSQVDDLTAKLLTFARRLRNLKSLTLTCTVVGCTVTETLAAAFAGGCWPLLTSFCIQSCSPEENARPEARNHLRSAFQHAETLQARLQARLDKRPSSILEPFTMQSVPSLPEAITTVLCEGYSHQLQYPEVYRCNKFTLRAVVSSGSLQTLHMYECNLTVQAMKAVAAVIARSPCLEIVHVCQSMMVFIREPLLGGLVAQLDAAASHDHQCKVTDSHAPCCEKQLSSEAYVQGTCASQVGPARSSSACTAPATKRLRSAEPDHSLKELHVLGHEYASGLDVEAVLQGSEKEVYSKRSQAELEKGPPVELLQQAQSESSALLQKVISGNPQLVSLRLDSWDEDEQVRNNSRFKLSDAVLASLCMLSCLESLGLNLPTLTEEAGCSISKAISPNLRMLVMHLDHDEGPPTGEQLFIEQLAPRLAAATALTSLEIPRSAPHACACGALIAAICHLTGLKRLRLASIGDAWAPEDPYRPHQLIALAKAVQQMPQMLQLELPLLSACDKLSMQALMSAVASCVHLESLELEACTDIEATQCIAPALQSTSQLRHLKLAYCKFGDAPSQGPDLAVVLGSLKRLESLVLKKSVIPDSLAQCLQQAITSLPDLQSLDIRCPPRSLLRYVLVSLSHPCAWTVSTHATV